MTKPNKLTAIEKLSTTSKANFSAFVSITHGHGGSHKCVFRFKMSGWLQGYRGWVWLLQERKKWQGYLSNMKMCTYLTSNLNLFLQTLWMVDWPKIELFSCILVMKSRKRKHPDDSFHFPMLELGHNSLTKYHMQAEFDVSFLSPCQLFTP